MINACSLSNNSKISILKILKISIHCIHLNEQPCKLYNNKDIIASVQITNTEIIAFIAVLVLR